MRKVVDTYYIRTAATTLPVSVADAKAHLRITHTDHDDLISDLIWGAVKQFEKRANVCLSAQTWQAFLDKGYEEIELWKYPITSISSINYYDSNNSIQTLSADNYYSNVAAGSNSTSYPRPSVIYVEDVPSTYEREDAFIIRFTAGFTTIDQDVKQALLNWVYRMYENPNDPVTQKTSFFDHVISDYRGYGI